MPPVFVEGLNGEQLPLRRDRTFSSYDPNLAEATANALIEKAKVKSQVFFYDLGCGEGAAASDFFDYVARVTGKRGVDPSLTDRIEYVGIDSHAGDYWRKSEKVRFYQGDLSQILSENGLPPIDVGVAHWVMPYIDDKINALVSVASRLSADEGIFISDPFYPHQIRQPDGNTSDADFIRACMPEGIRATLRNRTLSLSREGELGEGSLQPTLLRTESDPSRRTKTGYVGHPGQIVSHYGFN